MSAQRGAIRAGALAVVLLCAATAVSALDVSGLTDLDGKQIGASEVPNNAIIVFFATWSPKCRDIVQRSDSVDRKWGDTAPVFLVNFQEDREAVEKFLQGKTPRAKILLDRRAVFSKAHSVTSLPGVLAIKDGTLAFRGKLTADIDSVLRPIYE